MVRRAPRAPMAVPPGARSVFTDGACSGNPGPGGWAWALDRTTYASGSEHVSTNQRMEVGNRVGNGDRHRYRVAAAGAVVG